MLAANQESRFGQQMHAIVDMGRTGTGGFRKCAGRSRPFACQKALRDQNHGGHRQPRIGPTVQAVGIAHESSLALDQGAEVVDHIGDFYAEENQGPHQIDP